MLVFTKIQEMRNWVKERRDSGQEIGFVPTMGYLHDGHLSLVAAARQENQGVVMSIFVNPTQFGPQEDYAAYPRDLARDCRLAEEAGVDVVFAPGVEEMYPDYPPLTVVDVKEITKGLCGASRPGHFAGVATVVTKLFNIVQPDRAYFGQKDYQQVQVIKRMVKDLNIPVTIKTVSIKREEDGLAMSSRNTYLSPEERKEALCLSEALKLCQELYEKGVTATSELIEAMSARINQEPNAQIDYVAICDAESLVPVKEIRNRVVVALAVKIGRTRLIDNMVIGGESFVPDHV
ncbi:MAG: pantoate--beta-alanine ligase [Bacillota bacterium]|uniref:Pantothenate synthetase n=1 Tax=Thermanaerosceptrum fracticalcis TaxID=1712410 RepID=A0A7G6E5P8_THEFR|nr:pantoate--beta-alanine ligase [Thermanaerosceptrum fracticalcis]QNB47402.1 pantoate--beta-alanine ligase [Thermanaerosceptrum fracticalcis]